MIYDCRRRILIEVTSDVLNHGKIELSKSEAIFHLIDHMNEYLKRRVYLEGHKLEVVLKNWTDGSTNNVRFRKEAEEYMFEDLLPIIRDYNLKDGDFIELIPTFGVVTEPLAMIYKIHRFHLQPPEQ
ncbi:hypothetical protein L1987_39110 [Smallanthus sonchifolius]|uniref:Uncharacterized protein n=1 Tax=Smallanthus sonchifolius TaxID=185202 RepID=A0ACB9HKW0_9ASTR|nr:hypothetical protein L1987_39110 [Smallanthus sonchifolius]